MLNHTEQGYRNELGLWQVSDNGRIEDVAPSLLIIAVICQENKNVLGLQYLLSVVDVLAVSEAKKVSIEAKMERP